MDLSNKKASSHLQPRQLLWHTATIFRRV